MSGETTTQEPQPIYDASRADPAYQLRYTWTGWPSKRRFDQTPTELLAELHSMWETDGLRLLELNWTEERIQLLIDEERLAGGVVHDVPVAPPRARWVSTRRSPPGEESADSNSISFSCLAVAVVASTAGGLLAGTGVKIERAALGELWPSGAKWMTTRYRC
jgi:hypothetical protein